MKKTGPTRLSTRKLIREMQKKAKKSKQKIWRAIAVTLSKPARQRPSINLYKLEKLATRFDGKNFIIAGKVLASGEITKKISVIAFHYSKQAKQKIEAKKGNAMTLQEAMQKDIKPSEMMIVK